MKQLKPAGLLHHQLRKFVRMVGGLVALMVVALLVAGCDLMPDNTAPRLRAAATPAFVVGTQINAAVNDENPFHDVTFMAGRLVWSGSDKGSGICRYDVQGDIGAGLVPEATDIQATTLEVHDMSDYDGSYGGGTGISSYYITAHDCAGNTATVVTGLPLATIQDDGSTLYGAQTNKVTYQGPWSVSHCSCASGGSVHQSSTPGAAATFTSTFRQGDHVGLVFGTGITGAKAQIFIDGIYEATIDTHSATTVDRVVKWQHKVGTGIHRVKIVNLGSNGKTTTFDAVLTN